MEKILINEIDEKPIDEEFVEIAPPVLNTHSDSTLKDEEDKNNYYPESDLIKDRNIKALKRSTEPASTPKENLESIRSAFENHSYMYGQLVAIEKMNCTADGKDVLMFTVNLRGYDCVVMESDWWMKNTRFTPKDKVVDLKEYNHLKLTKARKMMGCIVPVIITGIEEIENGKDVISGQTLYKYLIGGSRVKGMLSIKDKYFLHKYHVNDITVKLGDIAKARVLGVSDKNVWLECLGLETYMPNTEADFGFVDNCKKLFHVGQEIKVKIRSLGIEGNNVYLGVSKKLLDIDRSQHKDAFNRMIIDGAYFGIVEKVKEQIYVVRLSNNVMAVVPFNHVKGGMSLRIGQRVNVICRAKYPDGYVVGSAFSG